MQNANIESLLKVAHAQWAYFRFGALIWRVCVCVCLRPSTVKALSVWNSCDCQRIDQ